MGKHRKGKKGRPKGAKNGHPDHVDAGLEVTRCRQCGSERRSEYHNKREEDVGGLEKDGVAYNRVTWRRTKCLDCGQVRDDITRDFVPTEGAPKKRNS